MMRAGYKRLKGPVLGIAVPLLLASGCGAAGGHGSGARPGDTHTMSDGTVMNGSQMSGMDAGTRGSTSAPSPAARMICNDETAAAVQRTFALHARPRGTSSWRDQTFRCRYQIPGGALVLAVKDLDRAGPGRAWFSRLGQRLPGARTINGMQNLGFPAFETSRGDVAFLKDHKTLWVNASGVPARALPVGFTRTEAAYGVAAAVVACWSE